jgi:hypothetical protein
MRQMRLYGFLLRALRDIAICRLVDIALAEQRRGVDFGFTGRAFFFNFRSFDK